MCTFVTIGIKDIVYKCCSGFGNWWIGLTVIGKNIADIIWFISLVAKMNVISLEGINNESIASFERELEKQTQERGS